MFVWMFDVRFGLNNCGFGTQVPDVEPTQPVDIYPLMINYSGFHVAGASWSRHRKKFLESSMTSFLWSRFWHFLRKEGTLNRFFYSEFDLTILEE
jgi:hypothetical protein